MPMTDLLAPPVSEAVYAFRAQREVTSSLFFTGPLWYAHVCHALGLDPASGTLGHLGLLAAPLDPGLSSWQYGEQAHLRVMSWGNASLDAVERGLRRERPAAADSFTEAFAFVGLAESHAPCSPEREAEQLRAAAAHLCGGDGATVRFCTPSRLKSGYVRRPNLVRPDRMKKAESYVDERTFSLRALLRACWARICVLSGMPFKDPESPSFSGLYRLHPDEAPWLEAAPLPEDCDALTESLDLLWLRAPYAKSRRDCKDIGGLLGSVRIRAALPPFWWHCLLAAGRRHIGLFTSFGFGRVEVEEARAWHPPAAPAAPDSLLDRALGLQRLRNAARELGGTAADAFGATPADMTYAKSEWFLRLRDTALAADYAPGPLRPYRFAKKDQPGEYREICVPALPDRVLQRSVHDLLAPGVDAFLAAASFAYRRGLNREGALEALEQARRAGYTQLVKADIASFFDRVDWARVRARLRLLYGDDPMVDRIMLWVQTPVQRDSGPAARSIGLPQGMALSPLLANLLLDAFDRELEREDVRLVRYCDDFVLLLRPDVSAEAMLDRVREILAGLGLALREDKTRILGEHAEFTFLGYQVAPLSDAETEEAPEPAEHDAEADPVYSVFSAATQAKKTVYLGGRIRNARSRNDALVLLNNDYEQAAVIPWKSVGRIIASGRISTTGSVQRMALQKGIPMLYLNIWGQPVGEAVPAHQIRPSLLAAQYALDNAPDLRLTWVRDTIAARIHNMRVVLRRHGIEAEDLRHLGAKALEVESVESARGVEGAAARAYWGCFAGLILPFPFTGRHYRPPRDPANAMLSFLYTLLHHRMACLLRQAGFDPARGFLHEPRAGHAALASDMMEEFRHFMELIVLRVVRQHMVPAEWFTEEQFTSGQPCLLPDRAFRVLINAFETRLQKEFIGRGNQRMSLLEWMEEQCRDLRAALLLRQARSPLKSD